MDIVYLDYLLHVSFRHRYLSMHTDTHTITSTERGVSQTSPYTFPVKQSGPVPCEQGVIKEGVLLF